MLRVQAVSSNTSVGPSIDDTYANKFAYSSTASFATGLLDIDESFINHDDADGRRFIGSDLFFC